MSKVLLFGGGLQVLSLARSLKETGHHVDVLGEHNEVSKKCRYVGQCFQCDLNTLSPEWFLDFVGENQYDVVIPMEDPFSDWLSKNKDEIERRSNVRCTAMDWEVYQLASDKNRLLAFCEEKGLPHPRTRVIGDDLDAVASYVGFPALIKPNRSNGARGIVKVENADQFKELAPKVIAEHGESALQEYIHTKDYYYNVML